MPDGSQMMRGDRFSEDRMGASPAVPFGREYERHSAFKDPYLDLELLDTVKGELVPRLQHAFGDHAASAPGPHDGGHDGIVRMIAQPQALARLLLQDKPIALRAFVDRALGDGISVGDFIANHAAPAARLLGALWHADRCSFTDVSIATSRLQSLVETLVAQDLSRRSPTAPTLGTFLLLSDPWEQHRLGIVALRHALEQAGWRVHTASPGDRSAVAATLAQATPAVIGVSIGSEAQLPAALRIIADVRRERRGRATPILVGGSLFVNGEHARRHDSEAGADADARAACLAAGATAIVEDLPSALAMAEQSVARRPAGKPSHDQPSHDQKSLGQQSLGQQRIVR
jgi:methylmalonyl-CoA mutase cobalamin-binding subunit